MTADDPRLDRDIAGHYGARPERDRLTTGPGRLEFLRTPWPHRRRRP